MKPVDFAASLLEFCALLRDHHGFRLGIGEITDALRAVERVNLADLEAVRVALRLVLCGKLEDVEGFDAAFTAFFFPASQGAVQDRLPPTAPPQRRPNNKRSQQGQQRTDETAPPEPGEPEDDPDFAGSSAQQSPEEDDDTAMPSDQMARGRFSPEGTDADAPRIPNHDLEPMLRAATALVSSLRLGRSRKWRALPRGARFDFRRTLRQSLSTGGDALHPRWQGHPRRNPRLVLLLDGSRSMLEVTAPVLQFALALSQRSKRVDVFTFSTSLRDISAELRGFSGARLELPSSTAWGGGTRIGDNLRVFLRDHAARVLTPDTLVIVSSDGLDVGDTETLAFAMRELRRRSAGILWLNPLAAHPEFQPTARGMRTALPYLSALTHADTPAEFAALATQL